MSDGPYRTALTAEPGRPIMPRFYAGFSLGAVAGAGLGKPAAGLGDPVGWHVTAVMVASALGVLTSSASTFRTAS